MGDDIRSLCTPILQYPVLWREHSNVPTAIYYWLCQTGALFRSSISFYELFSETIIIVDRSSHCLNGSRSFPVAITARFVVESNLSCSVRQQLFTVRLQGTPNWDWGLLEVGGLLLNVNEHGHQWLGSLLSGFCPHRARKHMDWCWL